MVNRCCIKNCKSEWRKSEGVTFHNVPLKEESRKKFIAAIPVNLQLSVQKYSRICSKHFTTDAFQATTSTSVRRILKRDAVPTLFDHQYHCTPVNEAVIHRPLTSSSVVSDENRSPNVPSLQSTMQHDSTIVKKDVGNQTVVQCSSAGKKDVGTQVLDNYLPPSETVQQLRQKIKILQRRLLRRDARLNTIADVIQHLKENSITTNGIEEVLENQFSGFPLAMFKNEVQNASVARSRQRYTEEMRSFALTLYFYSPKAYHFIRKELHLPSGPTLRTWLSTYNCMEVHAFLDVFLCFSFCFATLNL